MQAIKKITHINIKSGDMTFGQRIELGKIMTSKLSEIEKFNKIFLCLHGFIPKVKDYLKLIDYFSEIVEGLKFWIEQEVVLLKFEPSEKVKTKLESIVDPVIYNIDDSIGNTINALARNYNVEPADILNWEYKKVFQILLNDNETYERELYCSKNN